MNKKYLDVFIQIDKKLNPFISFLNPKKSKEDSKKEKRQETEVKRVTEYFNRMLSNYSQK